MTIHSAPQNSGQTSIPPQGVEEERRSHYPAIEDHGVIGNLHTVALVALDGTIDWCCFPRFDAPSIFGSLLDQKKGGHFRISPDAESSSTQKYLPETNVLVTEFRTKSGGCVEVLDFMPAPESGKGGLPVYHEIHRKIKCASGSIPMQIDICPRFDYALQPALLTQRRFGLFATDREDESLAIVASPGIEWSINEEEGSAHSRFTIEAGQEIWVVVRYNDDEVLPLHKYHSDLKRAATEHFWRDWAETIRYEGPHRDLVLRSALVLKLLFYHPTGAVVAAATTSLPEEMGGERNWDYRFVWLRDAAFTLGALHNLGRSEEADHFMDFLKRVTRWSSGHLQIMYGITGERVLTEKILDHLEGYGGSSPVRIGNGAYDQLQLDVYGEVMEAVYQWSHRYPVTEGLWAKLTRLVDWVAIHWRDPDAGIWEHRSGPQHYVFSKVLCWVALDRAVRLAETHALSAPQLQEWIRERGEVQREILEKGWNEEVGSFVQHYGTTDVDAALLLIPQLGFLPADDPRMYSTIQRIRHELTHGEEDFVYRYLNEDGLSGGEGVFSICTFWLADALILAGEVDHGERVFLTMMEKANHLGLFSEEIDPVSGAFLGNFPQAYTHIALINSALLLQAARAEQGPISR